MCFFSTPKDAFRARLNNCLCRVAAGDTKMLVMLGCKQANVQLRMSSQHFAAATSSTYGVEANMQATSMTWLARALQMPQITDTGYEAEMQFTSITWATGVC